MTQDNNGQNPSDLLRTADLLRHTRPEISTLRLDEIKQDVMTRGRRARPVVGLQPLRRRFLAFGLFVALFGISTSNAAASVLNFISGGTIGSKLGTKGLGSGTQYLFGSYNFGGDKSDDAGHETYCPDDKGSDDRDGSSSDNSDKDKYSDDRDKSSGDQSDNGGGRYSGSSYKDAKSGGSNPEPDDECESSDKSSDRSSDRSSEKSDDNDKSSGDHSDEKSDDNDKSSGDKSDGDKYSDDKDASSGDQSDEKSDDNDASSGDYSD